MKREEGVTFGDVAEEVRSRHARESFSGCGDAGESLGREANEASEVQPERRCTRIEASGVVAEASKWVRAARERLKLERQSSEECQS